MANEISIGASLSINKNSTPFTARADKTFDQTGNVTVQLIQNIGTSAEILAYGDLSGVPGAILVKNMDATNYVELSLDSGGTQIFAKLAAGRGMVWIPSVAAVYAKANTAACRLLILACEI